MKKPELYQCPDGFFEKQENAILAQTIGLESWRLPTVKNPEHTNTPADGYWLQMEEGIRGRILKPEKTIFYSAGLVWKPVLAGIMLLVFFSSGWQYFRQSEKKQARYAESEINQLNQQEILHYLTENTEAREISEQIALHQIPTGQLDLSPEVPVNAEQLIENLDETDLINNL
jgi:hypothetical protein